MRLPRTFSNLLYTWRVSRRVPEMLKNDDEAIYWHINGHTYLQHSDGDVEEFELVSLGESDPAQRLRNMLDLAADWAVDPLEEMWNRRALIDFQNPQCEL